VETGVQANYAMQPDDYSSELYELTERISCELKLLVQRIMQCKLPISTRRINHLRLQHQYELLRALDGNFFKQRLKHDLAKTEGKTIVQTSPIACLL